MLLKQHTTTTGLSIKEEEHDLQNGQSPFCAEHNGTLKEILDVFQFLLQQHEVRLCLDLLNEVKACDMISNAPLDSVDTTIRKVVAAFVEGQSKSSNKRALGTLETQYPAHLNNKRRSLRSGDSAPFGATGTYGISDDTNVSLPLGLSKDMSLRTAFNAPQAGPMTKFGPKATSPGRLESSSNSQKTTKSEPWANNVAGTKFGPPKPTGAPETPKPPPPLPPKPESPGKPDSPKDPAPPLLSQNDQKKKGKEQAEGSADVFAPIGCIPDKDAFSEVLTGADVSAKTAKLTAKATDPLAASFQQQMDLHAEDNALDNLVNTQQGEKSDMERIALLTAEHDLNASGKATGPWIINPNSPQRLCWDLLGVVFIVAEAFLVPLSLAFDANAHVAWFWLSTAYFMTDIVSQFTTGFYFHGNLVMSQRLIIKHYLKGFFVIDLIATLPWEYIVGGGGNLQKIARVGKLLRLFRLLRVLKLRALVDRIEDLLPGGPLVLVFSLMKMLMMFAVVCHWVACLWGFLGTPDKIGHPAGGSSPHQWQECEPGGPCEPGIEGSPWLRRNGLDNFEVSTQYLISLQFSAGLLMGADMGVAPAFWSERVFVIIMMIFSFFLCSVVLSEIVVIVNEMSQRKKELSQQIMCMKDFMRIKKLPVSLQAKVRQYLEYKHTICTEQQSQNQQFMNSLSQWLRLEVLEHVHSSTILHCPFFQEMPRAVLQRVCQFAVTVLCAHHDIVVHRGHRATSMLYIIKGKLSILAMGSTFQPQDTELQFMAPPSWIGYLCLFQDMLWPSTAISLGNSELLKLEKAELLELLEDFPASLQRYQEFQHRIERGDLIGAGVKCATCEGFGHASTHCESRKNEGGGAILKNKDAFMKLVGRQRKSRDAGGRVGGDGVTSLNETATSSTQSKGTP